MTSAAQVLKAVELDSAFGRYDVHDYHEIPMASGDDPIKTIQNLTRGLAKAPDKIIMPIRSRFMTFRNLQLPTRDKKSIMSAVGFELEDELPFPMDDAQFDYALLTQGKQGSFVHIAATLKAHLFSNLKLWDDAEISPDILTPESWAYRNLINRIVGVTETAPILLLQIGHQQTLFYLHYQGAPSIVREIDWGGRDISAALAKKFNISLQQAEALKLDRGFVKSTEGAMDHSAEEAEISACIEGALEDLLPDLYQVSLTAKAITHHPIKQIYTAGGTSLLTGLNSWIEEHALIPTKPLLALSSTSTSGVTYSDQTDARFVLAAASTLCLVGADRAICINFRKNEFSKESSRESIDFRALKKPLIALGTVMGCLFLSLGIQSAVYTSRLAKTNSQLEKSVRSFFGTISNSALRTYIADTKTLKKSVQSELNKKRELNKFFGPNLYSPLNFLNHISTQIPRDLVVDMTELKVGDATTTELPAANEPLGNATLSFLVANPQVAEKLANVMSKKLSHFQRGKTEEIELPDGGPKRWKISFSGNPTEDSYAKSF